VKVRDNGKRREGAVDYWRSSGATDISLVL